MLPGRRPRWSCSIPVVVLLAVFLLQIIVASGTKSPTFDETGELGEFKKYHNGSFCTPGNEGAETAIMVGGAEPCVAYSKPLGRYLMTTYNRIYWGTGPTLQVCYSDNLVDWSQPVRCVEEHAELSMPYFSLAGHEPGEPHNWLGEDFELFVNTNNTDVKLHKVKTKMIL
jgi:hypothetical protein